MKPGPEKELCDTYIDRFVKAGRGMGFTSLDITEVEDRKGGGKSAEGALLTKAIPAGSLIVCMDEHGKTLTSPQFANKLSTWRDSGSTELTFVIGGADGIASEVLSKADFKLSFGAMVWPHMLARVMLTEQLYRAASILAGHPYHRV